MRRTFFVCALLLTLPLNGRTADAPAPSETVIRLKMRPAPAPKPALKYQLLPELREMNPGNPIEGYLKSFMEQGNLYYNKDTVDKREKWLVMPLKDLPVKEMQYYKDNSGLREADYAARLDKPDWQILLKLKSEGVFLPLPGAQRMRALSATLKVRFRLELAERRLDDALVTAKTMFALARHVGENPTLVGCLIGNSIAMLMVNNLNEMISQPDCPNLFWALANLPHPFIDFRKGMQADRMMLLEPFASIDEQTPMSDAQVQQAMKPIRRMVKELHMKWDECAWLNELAKDEEQLRAARKRLIDAGLAKNKVKQFSAQQVTLVDEKLEFSVRDDESRKAMNLPYWQAAPIFSADSPRKTSKHSPFRWLEKSYDKVKMAQARLDQRLGLLRCVEALRMYAAEHDGKLPAKLNDIKLPLPVDAVSGKPFLYERKGDTAIVRGTPPSGKEKVAAYNVRYEVTIVK